MLFVFQSKEKDGNPREQYTQAPSYAPQAGAPGCSPQAVTPRYTAMPGGMAYALKAEAPEYTQQGTVIVTQPRVEVCQQQPVPSANLYLSICSCICCCWPLGELRFDLISKDLLIKFH